MQNGKVVHHLGHAATPPLVEIAADEGDAPGLEQRCGRRLVSIWSGGSFEHASARRAHLADEPRPLDVGAQIVRSWSCTSPDASC